MQSKDNVTPKFCHFMLLGPVYCSTDRDGNKVDSERDQRLFFLRQECHILLDDLVRDGSTIELFSMAVQSQTLSLHHTAISRQSKGVFRVVGMSEAGESQDQVAQFCSP